MKRLLLVAAPCALLLSCNNKSPETTQTPTQTNSAQENTKVAEEPPKPKPLANLAEPTHVAFDLLNNRPLAHDVFHGTYFVDAGRKDFVKYTVGNHSNAWRLGVQVEEVTAAVMNKKRDSGIMMPGPGATAKSVSVQFYNPSNNPNKLTIVLNGQELEPKELTKGWQLVTVDAKGHAKKENDVQFKTTGMDRLDGVLSGGAIAWVGIGDSTEPPQASISTAQGEWMIKPKEAAAWHVWGLPDAHLRVSFSSDSGCGVTAKVETNEKEIVTQEMKPVDGIDFPQVSSFSLDGIKDRVARVTLATTGECETKIHAASIVLPGQQPSVPNVDPPELVLFWMIDTLRADHLPIHFETDVEAPNIKKLAAEGASFEVAYVQGNESKTSHASLFSGMYPNKHGVVGRGSLKPPLELMPEAIKALKYDTGAYISNGYVSEPWGFVQGWNMYQNNLRSGRGGIHGKRMAKTALPWMTKRKGKNTFMYIGTIDPHVTYRRHEHLIDKYDPEPYSGRFKRACLGTDLGLIAGKKLKVTDRDKTRIQALYKNEITFNDEAFGWLREQLEAEGIWEKTMVVITADHGDQFWERGGVGHGSGVHQDQVHVPIIFYYPPLIPKGTVVSAGADVLDIYPTIVDALGGKRPDDLQGKSLLPLIHKVKGDYPEPAIATSYKSQYGLQMEQWKLYLKKGGIKVYDRKKDPLEKEDVAAANPLETRWLIDSMGWFRAHRGVWDKAKHGPASNLEPGFLDAL